MGHPVLTSWNKIIQELRISSCAPGEVCSREEQHGWEVATRKGVAAAVEVPSQKRGAHGARDSLPVPRRQDGAAASTSAAVRPSWAVHHESTVAPAIIGTPVGRAAANEQFFTGLLFMGHPVYTCLLT